MIIIKKIDGVRGNAKTAEGSGGPGARMTAQMAVAFMLECGPGAHDISSISHM